MTDVAAIVESLTPRDRKTLTYYRQAYFAGLLLEVFSCGLQLFMVLQGYRAFAACPKDRRRTRGLYIGIAFALLATSILTAMSDSIFFGDMMSIGMNVIEYTIFDAHRSFRWFTITGVLGSFTMILIVEMVMLYRCYLLWLNIWVCAFPALTCFAAFATAIALLICAAPPAESEINNLIEPLQTAYSALSASTNVILAALIIFRLLHIRRKVSLVLPSYNRRMYTGTITIILESAIPFALLGIVNMGLVVRSFSLSPGGYAAVGLTAVIWPASGALLQQILIYRVGMGLSWDDNHPGTIGEGLDHSIAFVHSAPAGRADTWADSHVSRDMEESGPKEDCLSPPQGKDGSSSTQSFA